MLATSASRRAADDGVSRRDFLRFGGLGVLAMPREAQRAKAEASGKGARRCIFILLTGGPSQLDTFDPKPHAPGEIRGPYRPIATSIAGVQIAETLPRLAERASKFALIRSLTSDAAPLHETGQQLLQTGRLVRDGQVPPSLGSMVAYLLGGRNNLPAYAVLPRPLDNTGASIWQGQGAGDLGVVYAPWTVTPGLGIEVPGLRELRTGDAQEDQVDSSLFARLLNLQSEPESLRRSYGETEFGRALHSARRLVEGGVRFVAVNMYDALGAKPTWDCHANPAWAPATVGDYRHTVCPAFDRGLSALLDDLQNRGLLDETLVIASGEFGRSPRLNERGGREHWTGVWSALLAGAGISGGQIVGASDSRGAIPAERPVSPAELAATVLNCLGVDLTVKLPMAHGGELSLTDAEPVAELS